MAELVACYILATWFLDAFNVIGFLWPNGDRGCGKTAAAQRRRRAGLPGPGDPGRRLLRQPARPGRLRRHAWPSTTPRTSPTRPHRPRQARPAAGRQPPRRHACRSRSWPATAPGARATSTPSARASSRAIRLPDPILASRTIVVPLIRTPDRYRANADPLDYQPVAVRPARAAGRPVGAGAGAPARAAGLRGAGRRRRARWSGATWSRGGRSWPWRSGWTSTGRGRAGGAMEALSVAYQAERPDLEMRRPDGAGDPGAGALRRARPVTFVPLTCR